MAHGLRIGRVAHAAGLSAKTIRYYEQVGVLPVPRRTGAGYRQYTPDGVERVLLVRRARSLRLPLRSLRSLNAALDAPGPVMRPRLRGLVRAQLVAVQRQMADLQLLHRQLRTVLQRLRRRGGRDRAGRCRCLGRDRGS
jgi:DNA-binding transcriptional MerR regulator